MRCEVLDMKYWIIVENKLRMGSNLYFTAKYDLLCLFTSIGIKVHFPLVSPSMNVMKIIIDLNHLDLLPTKIMTCRQRATCDWKLSYAVYH